MKKILANPEFKTYIELENSLQKRTGYRIVTAHSGDEALRIHRVERADLLIVGIDMPGMNGDDLCRTIKKDGQLGSAYVILVCADSESDQKRFKKSKADYCMVKPVNTDDLLSKMREVLGIRERAANRVPLKIDIVASNGSTFSCAALDVSISGILIETGKVLRRSESVGCLFCLPGLSEIIVGGKVVRAKINSNDVYQYGISFGHLPANVASALRFFIEQQSMIC